MAPSYHPLLDKPKSLNGKNLCLILSLAAIFGSAALIAFQLITINTNNGSLTASQICERAHDQASCQALLAEFTGSSETTSLSKPKSFDFLRFVLEQSVSELKTVIKFVNRAILHVNSARDQAGLVDCVELMDLSIDRIVSSMEELIEEALDYESYENVHSWLSSVLTNHVTCLDEIIDSVQARPLVEVWLNDLVTKARITLAIFVSVISPPEDGPTNPVTDRFPSWLTIRDRKLLESQPKDLKCKADVVVAKDGSGKYKTVKEAVEAAPKNSKTRYVIYVKKGVYEENVEIKSNKKNLMLVGEGMDATIITGNLSNGDQVNSTFRTATVAAVGDGFIAQDIGFQNTAGPMKDQAVALRVGADRSAIYRCRIDAYQDTLYPHSLRQFYRDCYITGTVDFIFGDAAVVLQNCTIVPRKPRENQSNVVTAQGRIDPNQNTGTSIQKCNIIASSDLEPVEGSVKTYLGRPWRAYSRTVFMQSYLGKLIDPAGWLPWDDNKTTLSTLFYGEYKNTGPGSNTSERVKWPGYHVIKNPKVAQEFTVAQLIQGETWLNSTGVPYQKGL